MPSRDAASLPPCAAGNLTARRARSDTAAGTTYTTITVTNNHGYCQMLGYPGVSLVDARGRQVGAAATREGATSSPVIDYSAVALAPGQTAHFTLRASNVRAYDPHHCDPVTTATHVKIYPPNDTGWLLLPFSGPACANPAITTLSVSPVSAGDGR